MSDYPILIVGDSYSNSNLLYKTRFLTNTPFIYLYYNEEDIIITAQSCWEQANKEANVKKVYAFSDFNFVKLIKKLGHRELAFVMMLKEVFEYFSIKDLKVPKDFPIFYANGLTKLGFTLHIDCDMLVKERSIKNDQEIEWIKSTQRALEKGMEVAESILRQSTFNNGSLNYENEVLTSDKIRKGIEIALLEEDCYIFETIVASGQDGSDPHFSGNSIIRPNVPILIDIFPFHRKNRYFADTSRTFVKGKADSKLMQMFKAVLQAQLVAINHVKSGVPASEIYQVACDSFKRNGYKTLIDQKPTEPMLVKGFIHSIGHGVGLDVHESPFLFSQDIELKAGNVITIEPGLYDPEIGGIRIEDLVLVTEDGCESITQYHKNFLIE